MSDFLTNLVMRSFAQTPSVQPVTLSAYAAPEPQYDYPESQPDPAPVPHAEPPVQNTNENKLVVEEVQPTVASPAVVPVEVPQKAVVAREDRTENSESPQPDLPQKSVVPKPRVISKPDRTIVVPGPTKTQREIQVQKTEPEIIENVVERVVDRPIIKSRSSKQQPIVEHVVEQSTVTNIERPSVTSIERSTVTIENTEQVSNSFTTLVPKVTPQSLPALRNPKLRSAQLPVDSSVEQETSPPIPAQETVINVAIGRIEVRATPADKPKRERQPGPKVMTLDDYMQQRSRGTQ